MIEPVYTASMNDYQRKWFYAEYQHASKDEVAGVLLALFLGTFGIHRFYLGQTGAGVLYLIFSWTGIPAILGFIECFFMPGRVRAYNEAQAQYIAAGIVASSPQTPPYAATPPVVETTVAAPHACSACGGSVQHGAAFCPHCGAAMAA
jgi:TM2 domain-containing membrane protein YozV